LLLFNFFKRKREEHGGKKAKSEEYIDLVKRKGIGKAKRIELLIFFYTHDHFGFVFNCLCLFFEMENEDIITKILQSNLPIVKNEKK